MAPKKPAVYRAVFFDLDDTIFDFGQCSRQAFFQACRCCHWSSSEEAFTEFQRLDQMLWSQQKAGHLTVEQVIHRRAESMARWFGHPEQSLAFQQRFSQCLAEEAALEPHARETLSLLHKKVPLYGASNGILAIQQARLEKANLTTYFSGLFVSDKIGAEQPDPQWFPGGGRVDGRRQFDRRYCRRLLCGYGWLLVPPPHSAPSCQHHFAPRHH